VAAKKKTITKSASKKPASKKPRVSLAILFWLAFIIFIFGLFLFNREAIIKSVQTVRKEMTSRAAPVLPLPEQATEPPVQPNPAPPPVSPPAAQTSPAGQPSIPPAQPQTPPVTQTPQAVQTPSAVQTPQAVQPAEMRERTLYFTQVDRSGSIFRVKAERKLPVSNSPMTDALNALISGPNEEESRRGLISLIPPGTKMLSVTVRGNTAIINFSEDFLYNTYGVEGYAGQLRQIVFTATEFPNIRDVQILIEGRDIHYLGEGIWIGSPISRDML